MKFAELLLYLLAYERTDAFWHFRAQWLKGLYVIKSSTFARM
jgi:hypothetical protein